MRECYRTARALARAKLDSKIESQTANTVLDAR
jgi:hypothetical protein